MHSVYQTKAEHCNHPPKDLSKLPKDAQKYPSLERNHLCDVKRSIFHPNLPTFRQIDIDNGLYKLSDEHCRNTTLCISDCFEKETSCAHELQELRKKYCLKTLAKRYIPTLEKVQNRNLDILKVNPSERINGPNVCEDRNYFCCRKCHLYLKEETTKNLNNLEVCCNLLDRGKSNLYKKWNAASMPEWYHYE